MTTQSGVRPLERHLMFMNFSAPMSAPNPASVTTSPSRPTSFKAIMSATTDELPCAMLANGPACTKTGVSSRVCIRVGSRASIISTASAPPTPRSSAVTGSPPLEVPMTMLPSRVRMSGRLVASASTAMISLATAMSKPVSRVMPFSVGDCPTVMTRRKRSFVSSTRRHVMASGSMSSRTNLLRSSGVSSSGSVLLMPSFFSRFNMTGAKLRAPSLSAGHRRRNSASSVWVPSW
mmetsp:Transcript_5714/g.16333  ORF Transcript_5714/g.16333 Transcript_5714/m.16333 type:complete len:234 (-) Transcript_5714:819-1520(-)